MRLVHAFAALPLALSLGFATPAAAKNVTADVQQIAQLMKAKGLEATIDKEDDGSPFIRSSSDGYPFAVFFYNCEDGKNCATVQFYAGFASEKDPTLAQMNDYAKNYRWGRIYLDGDGDPVIEMDVDLEAGGMSEDLFKDNLDYWTSVMSNFADFAFANDNGGGKSSDSTGSGTTASKPDSSQPESNASRLNDIGSLLRGSGSNK